MSRNSFIMASRGGIFCVEKKPGPRSRTLYCTPSKSEGPVDPLGNPLDMEKIADKTISWRQTPRYLYGSMG